jgi:D-alanyl-D-alanine dipeptidase
MRRPRTVLVFLAIVFATTAVGYAQATEGLPEGFVYVEELIPNIRVELRYLTDDNFIGRPVDGYTKSRCILTKEAAQALKKVQEELNRFGLGLKIYDAYRPQRAVSHFVRWAKDLDDVKMKSAYYPHVKKTELFRGGYIADRSSHSRGSTVDVTIVSIKESEGYSELDMGTGFDLFDPKSWPDNPSMSADQRAHRLLLRTLMTKHGFQPYSKEWWHFTLEKEPYPGAYFDFPVE